MSLMDAAARTNQQLALALRAQGSNEWADQLAYRAQVFPRQVLHGRRKLLRLSGSLLLDLVAGYGYRPLRSVITYMLVLGFALGYYLLSMSVHPSLSS